MLYLELMTPEEYARLQNEQAWQGLVKETANPTGKGVVGLGTMQDIDRDRQPPPGWVLTKDAQGRPVMIPAPQTAPAGQDDTAAKLQKAAAEMAKKAQPKAKANKANAKNAEKPMTVEELENQVKSRNEAWANSGPATKATQDRDANANPYELPAKEESKQPGGWDTFEPNPTVPGAMTEEEMARFYGR